MSRPKSPERIQRDLDKAIRKERRELKRKEREARGEARMRKQATRESVAKNGVPKIRSNGSRVSLQAAIAYSPCGGCHRIIGNAEIVSHFCGTCEYSEIREEVVDSPVLKAQQGDGAEGGPGDPPMALDINGERRKE